MVDKTSAVLDRVSAILPGADHAVCCGPPARSKPRDRIVTTARELFHQQGFRGVGVEAIAEAAGTNKMTLYRHFGSKDELIVECLRGVAADAEALWRDLALVHHADPMTHLLAWVREKAEYVLNDCRGCTLANAAVEITEADHPARRFIEECKSAYRVRLVDLCAAAGVGEAELLADALSLLLEGARVSRQSGGVESPSAKFIRTAEAMIAAFAAQTASPPVAVGG